MNTQSLDMTGSACCVTPLERHEFVGVDFNCDKCHRPRALHQTVPFKPQPTRSVYEDIDPWVRYRGPHPAFWRPGSNKKVAPPMFSKEQLSRLKSYRMECEHEYNARIERALVGDLPPHTS